MPSLDCSTEKWTRSSCAPTIGETKPGRCPELLSTRLVGLRREPPGSRRAIPTAERSSTLPRQEHSQVSAVSSTPGEPAQFVTRQQLFGAKLSNEIPKPRGARAMTNPADFHIQPELYLRDGHI